MRYLGLILVLSLIVVGHVRLLSDETMAADKPGEKSSATEKKPHAGLAARIRFEDGGGKRVYELKPESDGAKLVDANGHELARYVRSGDKLKVKGPDDRVLGYIVRHDDRYKIKDPDQKKDLFTLAPHGKGDWTVENEARERIHKVKHRDYGFEVESAQEKSLAKIKRKESKLSIRNPEDETTLSTKDPAHALGMACLALEHVPSLPLRMGLLVQITIDAPASP